MRWLEKASLPVSEIGKPQHARAVLDAISVRQDGRAAGATTIARKRSVFANVLRYAVELGELPSSPLDRLSWKPPKVSEVVDPRVVVNRRQARELLTAVTYVGQYVRGPYARGERLMGFYACMYFAALRPAEAVPLRVQDCYLPATGWGRLTLEKSEVLGHLPGGPGPVPAQPVRLPPRSAPVIRSLARPTAPGSALSFDFHRREHA